MLEWIPLWTISSGPEVLETSQDLSELESPERRTRKMMPKLLSIQPSNSSKLNHLLASKPKTDEYAKTDDQSNSCFILINGIRKSLNLKLTISIIGLISLMHLWLKSRRTKRKWRRKINTSKFTRDWWILPQVQFIDFQLSLANKCNSYFSIQ